MIRIIVKTTDLGELVAMGEGQVQTRIKSFDVNFPKLENYMQELKGMKYVSREMIGMEILGQEVNDGQS